MGDLLEKQKQLQTEEFFREEKTEEKSVFDQEQKTENVFETIEEKKEEYSLADKFETASKREVIMAAIDQKERVKTETVMKKKGIFGKKQAETVTYYRAEEQQVAVRQADADSLKEYQDLRNDTLADYRESVSLEAKAACGYENMKNLSQFANICDEETLKKYGKSEDAEGRSEVMDKLTSRIMDMDVNAYSNLSDKAICKNAAALEEMSAQVKAYRTLLSQNPKYAEKLKGAKLSDESSQLDQLNMQMEILGAISDYYRVRKMILMDGEYINSTKNIGFDITDADPASTVHLKEMMRMSYHLANRVNALIGGDVDAPELKTGETLKAKKVYGDVDNIFTAKTKEVDGKQEERTKADIEKDIRARIAKMELQNLSSNSFKSRDEDKLSFEKKSDTMKSKYVACNAFGSEKTLDFCTRDYNEEVTPYALDDIMDYRKEHQTEPEKECSEVHFKHATKYKTMDGFWPMDNLSRMVTKIPVLGNTLGLSRKETKEWFGNIGIANMKEYKEAVDALQDKDQKKVEEAKAKLEYLEEAHADAVMKSLIAHNAIVEKLAESLGQDFFLMHPEDLVTRISDEQWLLSSSLATITNILKQDKESDDAIRGFVDQYQKEHPEVASFNADRFIKTGNAYGGVAFKTSMRNDLTEYLSLSKEEYDEYDNEISYEEYEKVYGNDLNWDEIENWYDRMTIEDEKRRKDIKEKTGKDVRAFDAEGDLFRTEAQKKFVYYLRYHPEKIKAKHAKVFTKGSMYENMGLQAGDAAQSGIDLAAEGLIKPRTIKELKQYEASLKSRGKMSMNVFNPNYQDSDFVVMEHDKYMMKMEYQMIVEYVNGKEKRGESVSEEEKKERIEAQKIVDDLQAKDDAFYAKWKKMKEEALRKRNEGEE